MRWQEAQELLEAAWGAVQEAEDEDLLETFQQAQADRRLAHELYRLQEQRYAIGERYEQPGPIKDRYEEIFRSHGFDVLEGPIESLADRIRASAVREEILAAIDDWTVSSTKNHQRLLRVAARVDATNRWRKRLLQVKALRDRKKMLLLLDEAKKEPLSPSTAVLLANLIGEFTPEVVEVLARTRAGNEDNFWLHLALGDGLAVPRESYVEQRDLARQNEAIGYYLVALAANRDSFVVHNNLAMALVTKGNLPEAIDEFRQAITLARGNGRLHNNLGVALFTGGEVDAAIRSYREAIRLDGKLARFHANLGIALAAKGKLAEAITSFREAIRLDQKDAVSHANLGSALGEKGDMEGAIRSFREAIRLDPRLASAHTNLGLAQAARGDLEEAIRSFREAIRLNPADAAAHNSLGTALQARGDRESAIRSYREAIRRDPKMARAHANLGIMLSDKGDVEGAIRSYREATRLDPTDAAAHNSLGAALQAGGDVEGAIRSYREAIRLDPKMARAHTNLGIALVSRGNWPAAMLCFREAIRRDPTYGAAHCNLGMGLANEGDLVGAIRSFRETVRLMPDFALAHAALGQTLMKYGDFAAARIALRRAVELLGAEAPTYKVVVAELARCQRLLRLEQTLDAVVAGKRVPPDSRERIALADLAGRPAKQLYGNAVHLYCDAFDAEPPLADRHRYHAACAAVLAGVGRGKDAGKLDEADRVLLRYTALGWLQEECTEHARKVKGGSSSAANQSRETLLRWRKDADLASVRDPELLLKLPEAEQVAWRNLWAQVDALLAAVPQR
jgi:Flp pilus assembly protein TadD